MSLSSLLSVLFNLQYELNGRKFQSLSIQEVLMRVLVS